MIRWRTRLLGSENILKMQTPILATKYYLPTARTDLTPRPRLLRQICDGVAHPLLLISAPAGFGKTTVLAQWHASPQGQNFPLAWISLEPEDGEPTRFLTCLTQALAPLLPGVEAEVQRLSRTTEPSTLRAILAGLIQAVSSAPKPLVLVLDDYHVIVEPAVHDLVTFLIGHLPPQLRLILACRADPPLPLARLRVQGDLREIRAESLRFSLDESVAYLKDVMGLALTPSEIEALETRTEGWIAGLKLAALSLQRTPQADLATVVAKFQGSHRYVAAYLLEEVLNGQPDEVRTFLLQTSVLSVLNGELCNAVTGGRNGQAMLESLEQANLFTFRLDDDQNWFRYHHLFADLLRHRLDQLQPGLAAHLNRRAVAWYQQRAMWECAIDEACHGEDFELAATVMARAYPALVASGQAASLTYWLQTIPSTALERHPTLASLRAATSGGRLTAREQEVLQLISRGASNREIARVLVVSLGTVKKHLNNIFNKLAVQSRTQAIARAREAGLL
jgi:LuxR family transcriptional regulator, maltose regulon positive regulatory protein